jgi:hypothetical protein
MCQDEAPFDAQDYRSELLERCRRGEWYCGVRYVFVVLLSGSGRRCRGSSRLSVARAVREQLMLGELAINSGEVF